MDIVKLLSRGTKSNHKNQVPRKTPSSQQARPSLFSSDARGKKRKRDTGFEPCDSAHGSNDNSLMLGRNSSESRSPKRCQPRIVEERRSLLRQHKIKVLNLSSHESQHKAQAVQTKKQMKRLAQVFPDPCLSFEEVTARFDLPSWLETNLSHEGYRDTTEVQMAALPLLLSLGDEYQYEESADLANVDLLTVAPTGSGKTLSYLVPVLTKIAQLSASMGEDAGAIRALILAPTRELMEQIVRVGKRLTAQSKVKIIQYRKGMKLSGDDETSKTALKGTQSVLVSTPGILHHALQQVDWTGKDLENVLYLILDEADVLLDPMFREKTVSIWNALKSSELRVSMWSATMGSNIEQLAQRIIQDRWQSLCDLTQQPTHSERPKQIRLVVGLKDSAVPNVQHKLVYAATEQGKLMGLRQLLHSTAPTTDSTLTLRPPFLVFTQTIERAKALYSELLYDIPVEAGGISRIAVLHSDLSDSARDDVMARFRKAEIWILITTDLLSRGIDFRGVNGVVNYDIPTSSAAYVHRIGRTGRAGREGGVAVTFYTEEDIPYLKHIANVIAVAQRNSDNHDDSAEVQQWLLKALPSLSKNGKQKFKTHGVEMRTARGALKDAHAARKARISTKAGYLRREENRRKGAAEASRRRLRDHDDEEDDVEETGSGFDGFGA